MAPTVPSGLAPVHQRALHGVHAVEVHVERVEAETVVEDDEAAGEEEVAHQRHSTAVGGEDRRPPARGVVEPGVRAPRLAVDDATRSEAVSLALAADRSRERAPPEALRGEGVVERGESFRFGLGSAQRLRIQIHLLPGQREALHRELPRLDREPAGRRA